MIKIKKEDLFAYLLAAVSVGIFVGYGWRMVQGL